MLKEIASAAIHVDVTLSKMYGDIEYWSIVIDGQRVDGSDYCSMADSIAIMMDTPAGSMCCTPGGLIRMPHPQAAMAADVMLMDCSQSVYLVDSARLVPDSPETAEFLDPFYTVGPADNPISGC